MQKESQIRMRKGCKQQGALTCWRAQTERQVRIQKECEPERGTHSLESPDRETSQDTERMRARKGHSLPGEPRQRDKSGKKGCKQARGTYVLESPDGETSHDTERMRASGPPRCRDKSGYGKDVSRQAVLTSWRAQTERQVRTRKECEPTRSA